ncbi:MAG: Cpe/LpqF family protein, partial [Thermomicrobiales bacterium]
MPAPARFTTSRRVAIIAALALATGLPSRIAATPEGDAVQGDGLATTQFRWLFDRLNAGATDLTADDITAHFTARFVAAVGIDAIIAELHDIATASAPFTITTVIQQTEDLVHVQAADRSGAPVVIAVSIEHSDGKIAGFIVQPGTADAPLASPAASPVASPIASP